MRGFGFALGGFAGGNLGDDLVEPFFILAQAGQAAVLFVDVGAQAAAVALGFAFFLAELFEFAAAGGGQFFQARQLGINRRFLAV